MILHRGPQFTVGLMKELNEILEMEMKLSIAFHPQTDRQMEKINQELEQYLRIYINHRQNNWSEWLVTAEFAFSNKVHICYELRFLGLDNRTTLVLSNTRELDRDLSYKLIYLIYYYQWSVLATIQPTLNNYV